MALGISAVGWAAIGTTAVGLYSANQQAGAAEDAANAQVAGSQQGIAEQNRRFDAVQKLLAPYATAGTGALGAQQNLIGLGGPDAQRSAIDALKGSPEFAALTQQGEDSILANASATGGLRGGNTEAALAQFRPQLLAQLINEQYGRLGGLTSLGQNAAAGVGNAGIATGQGISSLYGQIGAAQAGSALAQGKANIGYGQAIAGGLGSVMGSGYVPNTTAMTIPPAFKF